MHSDNFQRRFYCKYQVGHTETNASQVRLIAGWNNPLLIGKSVSEIARRHSVVSAMGGKGLAIRLRPRESLLTTHGSGILLLNPRLIHS